MENVKYLQVLSSEAKELPAFSLRKLSMHMSSEPETKRFTFILVNFYCNVKHFIHLIEIERSNTFFNRLPQRRIFSQSRSYAENRGTTLLLVLF